MTNDYRNKWASEDLRLAVISAIEAALAEKYTLVGSNNCSDGPTDAPYTDAELVSAFLDLARNVSDLNPMSTIPISVRMIQAVLGAL